MILQWLRQQERDICLSGPDVDVFSPLVSMLIISRIQLPGGHRAYFKKEDPAVINSPISPQFHLGRKYLLGLVLSVYNTHLSLSLLAAQYIDNSPHHTIPQLY